MDWKDEAIERIQQWFPEATAVQVGQMVNLIAEIRDRPAEAPTGSRTADVEAVAERLRDFIGTHWHKNDAMPLRLEEAKAVQRALAQSPAPRLVGVCPACNADIYEGETHQCAVPDAAARVAARPEVVAFASLMEAKLRENDWKGGWSQMSPRDLLRRLSEEVAELYSVYQQGLSGDTDLVGKEAADVANFAMMIADVEGALSATAPDAATDAQRREGA